MRTRLVLLIVVCVFPLYWGCQSPCDPPAEQATSVRVLNAIPGLDTLMVYIDGRLFSQSYYEIEDKSLYPRTAPFGYQSSFVGGNTILTPGRHHITVFAPSDLITPLSDTTIAFNHSRQTLVYFGNPYQTQPKIQMIYLDDNTRSADPTRSLARFVHVASDLETMDVYFADTIKRDASGKPAPDLKIGYGQISDEHGTSTGTGRSATDYFEIPHNSSGLLITRSGDTNDVIFILPIGFSSNGFFCTVIVRGSKAPLDHQPIVAPTVLTDGLQTTQPYLYSIPPFAIRLINATRSPYMTLLVKGNYDAAPRIGVALQQNVLYVERDSISRYWPLTTSYHGEAEFYLSPTTIKDESSIFSSIADSIHQTSLANTRYSYVAIDSNTSGGPKLGFAIMVDTLGLAGPGMTRVRFFNASASHQMNFTFAGRSVQLGFGESIVLDTTIGTYTIPVHDGSANGTISLDLADSKPYSVFFLPPVSGNDFPMSDVEN